jgi:sRNA-binding regulator protein Hfq
LKNNNSQRFTRTWGVQQILCTMLVLLLAGGDAFAWQAAPAPQPAFDWQSAAPARQSSDTGQWDQLGRLSKKQTVKVYLRDGRVLKGAVCQFGADGLGFVGPENVTQVKRGDITRHTGNLQKKEVVELTLQNGRVLNGTVQELSQAMVGLLEPQNIVQLKRTDVLRVTIRTRSLTAGIGALALGGAVGIVLTTDTSPKDTSAVKAFAIVLSALVGAAIGAGVGRNVTLYKAEPRK